MIFRLQDKHIKIPKLYWQMGQAPKQLESEQLRTLQGFFRGFRKKFFWVRSFLFGIWSTKIVDVSVSHLVSKMNLSKRCVENRCRDPGTQLVDGALTPGALLFHRGKGSTFSIIRPFTSQNHPIKLDPGRLTWNLKMMVWKMIFLFNWVIWRFHVNLPGCRPY